MKLLHLTPGTGSFHCGSCLRDNALIKALRARGMEAVMAPLYLPMVTDADEMSDGQPVRVGGITLYLQQKMPRLATLLPVSLKRWLDDEKRLRWASQFMGMTSPRDLGEMTVGSLLGEKGSQWAEWKKLIDWIETEKPDVISLSNSLLIGLAPALKKRVNAAIVVSLQGEDSFLDTLPEPWRKQAWDLMQENARSVDCFIAPSRFYSDVMQSRLAASDQQMAVVYNGLDFVSYTREKADPEVPTIGYLARMIHGKGLTTLVDAFIDIAGRNSVPGVTLRIAGAYTPADKDYVEGLKTKLNKAGLADRVAFEPNVTYLQKVDFLHEISVFTVPATYGEAFGLYIAEAMGCGVAVVQPEHGAFPEIIELTGGGVLCTPDDPQALADRLEQVLINHEHRLQLEKTGKENARKHFSATQMAETFSALLYRLAGDRS